MKHASALVVAVLLCGFGPGLSSPGPALAEPGAPHPSGPVQAKRDVAEPEDGKLEAKAGSGPRDLAATVPPHPLPPAVTTEHQLALPGRTLRFKATAGAIRLGDAASGQPIADIAYTAFQLDGPDRGRRPLTIAINGGPGASSAWLDLGAIGPWRLPVDMKAISPSMPTALVDNAETWLDFTDLLFIDPIGTGYSRMIGSHEEAEKRFRSIDGDIDELATVARKWLVENGRLPGPKFILGESYGGFRAPKLARKLERGDGVGIAGVIMLSPVLDFGWFDNDDNPAVWAGQFPSLVAAARGIGGPDPRAKLADAEAFASGPYLTDLYRGVRDAAAVKEASAGVARLTGADETFVARLGGRVDASDLTRDRLRASGRVSSSYDAAVTGWDPEPFAQRSHHEDPILDALKTPMAEAMATVDATRLGWPVNARYEILNPAVNAHWDWDSGRHPAQATGDLAALLALDPAFRAIVMHGVGDQVTPYFTSQMLIDQIPRYGDASRLTLKVYGGGHMPYLEDGSRKAMREDARSLIEETGAGGDGTPRHAPTTPDRDER